MITSTKHTEPTMEVAQAIAAAHDMHLSEYDTLEGRFRLTGSGFVIDLYPASGQVFGAAGFRLNLPADWTLSDAIQEVVRSLGAR